MPQFNRCSCTLKLGESIGKMAGICDVIKLNAHRASLVGKTGNYEDTVVNGPEEALSLGSGHYGQL